ncbi:MAG: alpha/beta hydrolase [Acidobacteriaceae bacterium]|nr:alpha/beta hydrolase [Acidobacteriaceae bacterium]
MQHAPHAAIRSVEDLRGPAGRLEAVLNTGHPQAPYAALVCHPHPLGGGSLHNKVVYHTMKAFSSLGLPVLRFNFRGVGLSEGSFDDGRGEIQDTRAALDWLDANLRLPILLAGFSFGSWVGLQAGCGDPRVQGLIGLGVPSLAEGHGYSYEFLTQCAQPKLFVCGAEDQFGPRDAVEAVLRRAAEPRRMVWIEGAEHFFQGTPSSPTPKLDQMHAQILDWLRVTFPALNSAELH